MADGDPVGKTILQLELFEGTVDRAKSYIEIHVVGNASSQRIPLSELAVRGLSAKEVIQLTHPEVVTDEDFIAFISGADGTNGKSAFELAQDAGFTGTQAEWLAGLNGKDGKDGTNGTDGKSAYQVAQDAGFTGTPAEWLLTLAGKDGVDGLDGKSNYDLALEAGFTGSLQDYLASVKGADGKDGKDGKDGTDGIGLPGDKGDDGKSAYQVAVDGGFVGDEAAWLASLKGADGKDGLDGDGRNGKSAYEIAQDAGFTGDEAAWLVSLIGPKGQDGQNGADGKSAYQIALDAGFIGTEAEFIASLKGADGDDGVGTDGKSAYELAVEEGFVGTEAQWIASLQAQLNQANLQSLLNQYNWTVKQTLRARGLDGALSANGAWANFLFLFDKRLNQKDGDINLFDKINNIPQKVLEAGFLNAEGIAYFKITDAPSYTKDPANPDNTKAQFFITNTGVFGVGDQQNNILFGDGSKITVTTAGVAKVYDLENQGGGAPGADGKSAYQIALDAGFVGDEVEWLLSLHGANGTDGTNGADGKSAYQIAVDGGFVGTPAQWLDTLEGKSAYDIARDEGFVGNETAWLATLVGPTGPVGPLKILGNLQGSLETMDQLPDASEYENSDYFFVGGHVVMNSQGAWVDVGQFEGPPGKDGLGITVLGSLNSVNLLPATGAVGDAWLIGKSMYVWQGDHWQEQGQEGLRGEQGPIGPEGKSSFEVVKAANPQVDTMAKYVEFIRGLKGDKGDSVVAFAADGVLATIDELPASGTENHGYLIGNDATDYEFHVWVDGEWVNLGNDIGPPGPPGGDGPVGPAGKSMTPKGIVATVGDLPAEDNTAGDTYSVGSHFYSWDGTAWIDMGDFSGVEGDAGPAGPAGPPLNPKGQLAAEEDLPAANNTKGDAYEITGNVFVYDGAAFVDMGPWRGPVGPDGKSAYQIALDAGFVGNEQAWRDSLKGVQGEVGPQGIPGIPMKFISVLPNEEALPGDAAVADTYMIGESYYAWNGTGWGIFPALKGINGTSGADGISLSFVGNFADQASLPVGTLSQVATAAGRIYIHDATTWVDSGPVGAKGEKGDTGADGKSAYDLALAGGFVGDVNAWLLSLKGDSGAVGKSLYQDAVDSGAFHGTLQEFIDSQKGAPGVSAYQDAIDKGVIAADATFADFMLYLQGPQGEVGPAGSAAPAISIIGTLANQAALPAQGTAGTGYAIPDPNNAGVYDCWIWLTTTNAWFNLGHVVGAAGPQGNPGPRGLQGLPGAKGDQGTLWIVFTRDPQAQDGRINDYFFNSLTQEFFRKTDAITWASLGHIGGGNLNSPAADGKIKGIKDGAWVDLSIINNLPTTTDGTVYQLVNGLWVKFDVYTLAVLDAVFTGTATTCDWALARQFRITNNTTGAKTVALTNLPGAARAATVVVKVYGKTAAFNWTIPAGKGTLRWFDGAAPTFVNDTTTIVFNWDGQEIVGSVPN